MGIQNSFKEFNNKIRVDFEKKAELREKRDILLRKLRNSDDLPPFKEFNQGSYAMFTGVEPGSDSEYDIDVGLQFLVNKDDYAPIELKNKIYEILKNHTEYGAKIKKPCVTVTYQKDGEAKFHVDLVVYCPHDKDYPDYHLYIAKGTNETTQCWEIADPKALVNYVNNMIEKGEKLDQFRRIIRYLKSWKNLQFSTTGHASPPGIGLTLIALENFIYHKDNDLESLIHIVNMINEKFIKVRGKENEMIYRIIYSLPSHLNFKDNNIFEKMTDSQMTHFKEKIAKLLRELNSVSSEPDEHLQYEKLRKIFGKDFLIPNDLSCAKEQVDYIPSSSASGCEIL
ncbi:hypothetical protein A6A19_01070 [Actinobacillus delphinicola]|uniref:nucleotidyltransferase domain-containing protein n=1 Tax=Actinobacillus delphinicola TaxID=51161 RepID=UPI0024431E82|nr:nucleotidyltransferase [Actinobacillus delphinicola]MDG6896620.1 hypothetical protein [Actinobacillus delphinicola]